MLANRGTAEQVPKILKGLFQCSSSELSEEQKDIFQDFLIGFQDVFLMRLWQGTAVLPTME